MESKEFYRKQLQQAREILKQKKISNEDALKVYRWSSLPLETENFEPRQVLGWKEFFDWSTEMAQLNIQAFLVNPAYIICAEGIDTRWSKEKDPPHEDKLFKRGIVIDGLTHTNDLGKNEGKIYRRI